MVSLGVTSSVITPPRKSAFDWQGKRAVLLLFCLITATLAIYGRVHAYPFIDIDDNFYVTENSRVLGPLNLAAVKWAFTHPFALNYDPLTFFSHNLDVRMFGLNAGRHHDVNLLLHVLNALLLFWVLKRATGYTGRSFVAAALFAVHPLQVENVAWISERKTLLSAVFFLLALHAYRWYARNPRRRRMAVVAFLYGLGLLAKPQVIMLPFVLLLWDYWPLRRLLSTEPEASADTATDDTIPPRRLSALVKEKIPLFVIAGVDSVLTVVAEHKTTTASWQYPLAIRLGNAILSYSRYIAKAFWPDHLALMYLHPGYSLRWGQVWASLLLLVAVSLLVAAGRRHRYLVVGWLLFLGMMVPTIGLVQVDASALADRYAYLPLIGLFLIVCWGAAEWAEQPHLRRFPLPAASIVALSVLAAMTYRQVGYWSDPITLWTHTLEVTHRNWIADGHLGAAYREQGQPEQALAHFYRAAEDGSRDPYVNLNIALIEHQRGNQRKAIPYYEKVLALSPDDPANIQVLINLGHAYDELGDHSRAAEYYLAASRRPRTPLTPDINWHGAWWRDVGPYIRARMHEWRAGDRSSPQ